MQPESNMFVGISMIIRTGPIAYLVDHSSVRLQRKGLKLFLKIVVKRDPKGFTSSTNVDAEKYHFAIPDRLERCIWLHYACICCMGA